MIYLLIAGELIDRYLALENLRVHFLGFLTAIFIIYSFICRNVRIRIIIYALAFGAFNLTLSLHTASKYDLNVTLLGAAVAFFAPLFIVLSVYALVQIYKFNSELFLKQLRIGAMFVIGYTLMFNLYPSLKNLQVINASNIEIYSLIVFVIVGVIDGFKKRNYGRLALALALIPVCAVTARSAVIAVTIPLMLFFYLNIKSFFGRLFIFALTLLVVILSFSLNSNFKGLEYFDFQSTITRISYIENSLLLVMDNIFGVGYGLNRELVLDRFSFNPDLFIDLFPENQIRARAIVLSMGLSTPTGPHNFFISVTTWFGVFGALFVFYLSKTFVQISIAAKDFSNANAALYFIALGLIINSMFLDQGFFNIIMLLGIIFHLACQLRRKKGGYHGL